MSDTYAVFSRDGRKGTEAHGSTFDEARQYAASRHPDDAPENWLSGEAVKIGLDGKHRTEDGRIWVDGRN